MAIVMLGALITGLIIYKNFWRAFTQPKLRLKQGKKTILADLHRLAEVWSIWFLYDAMTPEFPPAWNEQPIGSYLISPMPFDLKQPYAHHDEYVKDFLLLIK